MEDGELENFGILAVIFLLLVSLIAFLGYQTYMTYKIFSEADKVECGIFSCTATINENTEAHIESVFKQCYVNGERTECPP